MDSNHNLVQPLLSAVHNSHNILYPNTLLLHNWHSYLRMFLSFHTTLHGYQQHQMPSEVVQCTNILDLHFGNRKVSEYSEDHGLL